MRFLLDTNFLIPLENSQVVLEDSLAHFVRLANEHGQPVVSKPCVKLIRPQDERHPVMKSRHGFVGCGGEHHITRPARFLAPKPRQAKDVAVRLPEKDAFLIKPISQQQATLGQMFAERGYSRIWVSEHHNLNILQGSTPEVLLAAIGAQTTRIRLGSGGVMLPNASDS